MTPLEYILGFSAFAAAGCVGYAYLGYPALVYVLSRTVGRKPQPPYSSQLPSVTLLIIAHNEATIIESRIRNALSLDYPPDRLSIIVASDGSTDATADICARFRDRISTLAFPVRRGKPATINAALPFVHSDIVVFSDANTFMDPNALGCLARWFADTSVGAVCGKLVLIDPSTGRNSDGLYWRYESLLKECESRLNALLGASGAIYALRRELFTPLSPGTLVDDFVIPLAAKLKFGRRIVYDPQAIAREDAAPDLGSEFHRRARIGAGGWQALTLLWPLLSPLHGWTALALWSHKVLRWIAPFCMLIALGCSLALLRHPVFAYALGAQVGFYLICGLCALLGHHHPIVHKLRLFPMFLSMNAALLVGWIRWVRGSQSGVWKPTSRLQE